MGETNDEACRNAGAAAMAVLCDACRDEFDRRLRRAEPASHYLQDYVWHSLCRERRNRMLDLEEQETERGEQRDVRG